MLFIIAVMGLDTFQLDIKNAFVRALLLETVFILPCREAGMVQGTILRCIKSIYGLPQAGANWFRLFKETLLNYGLTQSVNDGCLFILKKPGVLLFAIFHVDDVLIEGPTQLIQQLVSHVQKGFPAFNALV